MTNDDTHRVNIKETDERTKAPAAITKAVAIEYERGVDAAPRVTASGKGAIAEQILAIAFARGIKVREDAELVEILSLIEVDSPIPLEAFTAVAEILAFVYQANAARQPSVKE
ncbi:MAG: EscU/YscU/HrcU family type III secretion system export apparatus switch protein [Rickettsiales bacterium]|nr:EscU/YscU/HrcU family type III secretion system export apparatus switch protein [Rickettsiales bacterium]